MTLTKYVESGYCIEIVLENGKKRDREGEQGNGVYQNS